MKRKIVLITGVSNGIGKATAELYLEYNWNVIGVDKIKFPKKYPKHFHFIKSNLALKDSPRKIIKEVERKFGNLDSLINNAAIQICKPLVDTSIDEWEKITNTNLRSVFLLIKNAYPLLKKNGGGSIVNVCSVHSIVTSKGLSAYATSKGGLLMMTKAASIEFSKDNIRVNSVLPGAIDTKMLENGLTRGHLKGSSIDDLKAELGKKHSIGRIGLASEVAHAIHFLSDSEKSSFINGQSIVVDGGATAKLSTE